MDRQIERNKRRSLIVVALFGLLWMAVGAGFGTLFGSGTDPSTGRRALDLVVTVTATTIVFGMLALGAVVYALRRGPQLVLSRAEARPADPVRERTLHDVVEALAIGDGLPKPDVYVIDDPSLNAFVTGTSPAHAAVTVTAGLLSTMNREELEGVIGNQMSRIKNYDVRLTLVVTTLIGLAAMLAAGWWRAVARNRFSALVLISCGFILPFVILGFIAGPVAQLALSRSRELLADASAVRLTGNPDGLIGALQKLADNRIPLRSFGHTTGAMFIDDPARLRPRWWGRWFNAHPPLAARIAAVEAIASAAHV